MSTDDMSYIQTNVLQLGLSTNGGVFETCSRINHSCSPNMQNTWSPTDGQIFMHAIKDIPVGAELTISYLDVVAPSAERKTDGIERYSFSCTCEVCLLPLSKRKASDVRRQQVAVIQGILQQGLMIKPFRNLELVSEFLSSAMQAG